MGAFRSALPRHSVRCSANDADDATPHPSAPVLKGVPYNGGVSTLTRARSAYSERPPLYSEGFG